MLEALFWQPSSGLQFSWAKRITQQRKAIAKQRVIVELLAIRAPAKASFSSAEANRLEAGENQALWKVFAAAPDHTGEVVQKSPASCLLHHEPANGFAEETSGDHIPDNVEPPDRIVPEAVVPPACKQGRPD